MINIMVDSCVFFNMITYNNFVNDYGKENLGEFIEKRVEKLKELEEKLTNSFGDEFNKKYAHLSFDEKLSQFKDYSTNLENSILSDIVKNKHLSKGEVFDHKNIVYENGVKVEKPVYRKNDKIPQATRNKARDEVKRLGEVLKNMTKYDDIKSDKNKYKLLRDSINDGIIYRDALEGKYNLHVCGTSFDEIIEHTKPRDYNGWAVWRKGDIDSLAKNYCTIVDTNSEMVTKIIDDLAKKYRTKLVGGGNSDDFKEMAEDINSVGEYGDSKIAAIASLSGMTLVTNNGKDFIFDKSTKTKNDKIRKHISEVNANHEYASDATVVSAEELVAGIFSLPQKQSGFEIVTQDSEREAFERELLLS